MRLLVAEDEIELSEALVTILKHNKYSVDAVYNGVDALDYASMVDYDGIILDIMMPGMTGLDVLKKLRERNNKVPVLILSARSETDDLVEGLDQGADDYLTKPFEVKELLARIRSVTRRRNDFTSSSICINGISLDSASFSLITPEGELHLPNKEYQILEMLMVNNGQIISVDRIMEKIWGYDSEIDANSVWVHISNIRKKLKKINAGFQIKAARGQGYFIEEC